MKDFKYNQKMKSDLPCFKEGGYVTKKQMMAYEKKEDKAEEKKDIAEDKKIVKKAIGQHEAAQHKGSEKTEIKLKGGRRVKKAGGTVGRYKAGGTTNPGGKGKPSGDKDKIKKIAEKPKKAAAPSKAKVKKTEVPGKEMGPSGAMDPMMAPPAAGPEAAAPSAAMMMPEDGVQNMATGRRPFFNEEPDDFTAVPTKRRRPMKRPPMAPAMGGMGAVSDAERQAMMPQGPGAISDEERAAIMQMFQGGPQEDAYGPRTPIIPQFADGGAAFGGAFGTRQPQTADGMGQATPSGGMGNAAPLGAPSDQERNIMRGLAAIGSFCYGGKVK